MSRSQSCKVTVDSVISYMKVPPDLVDQWCTREHLTELSLQVHSWENIIGFLGFGDKSGVVQDDLRRDYPLNAREQTRQMFLKWRDLGRPIATYRKLLDVFINNIKNVELAEQLCEIMTEDEVRAKPAREQPNEPPQDEEQPDSAANEVEILLTVFNENEYRAVKSRFQEKSSLKPHPEIRVPIGEFGKHEVALLHVAGQGDSCSKAVRMVLQGLKQVHKVIAIGIALGANPEKQMLGDVLVSKYIAHGNWRVEHAVHIEGPTYEVPVKLSQTFCVGTSDWDGLELENERKSQVHTGLFVSGGALWKNDAAKAMLLAGYKGRKFIGGEMEGGYLCRVAEDVEEEKGVPRRGEDGKIGVIIIKGVADYGDGKKTDDWQLKAAKAAASYAEFQLKRFAGHSQ